jgi:transposase-like protein
MTALEIAACTEAYLREPHCPLCCSDRTVYSGQVPTFNGLSALAAYYFCFGCHRHFTKLTPRCRYWTPHAYR